MSSIPKTVNLLPYSPNDANAKPLQPRSGVLYGKSVDDFITILNNIAQNPPKFENKDIVGVPFLSLFLDLTNTRGGQLFFSNNEMNSYLKEIINDYAKLLKSPESLKYMNKEEGGWFSPKALKKVNYEDFICDPNHPSYGFKCWNDWFTRGLKPNARPIDMNPNVIVNNSEHFPLTDQNFPIKNINYDN